MTDNETPRNDRGKRPRRPGWRELGAGAIVMIVVAAGFSPQLPSIGLGGLNYGLTLTGCSTANCVASVPLSQARLPLAKGIAIRMGHELIPENLAGVPSPSMPFTVSIHIAL